MKLAGWPLVGWAAIALLLLCTATLLANGTGPAGLQAVVLATAKTSCLLFLSTFLASSVRSLYRNRASRWLLHNRRYLGVSFATSHGLHLVSLIVLGSIFPDRFYRELHPLLPVAGGIGYLFIAAMAATSFDRSAAWLGPRRWKLLHKTGGYYILSVFALDFVEMALVDPFYLPFALAIVAVLGLRVAGRLRRPRPAQAAAGGARRL